jgi:hypothetical protein
MKKVFKKEATLEDYCTSIMLLKTPLPLLIEELKLKVHRFVMFQLLIDL